MNDIPCENCIVLPICKIKMKKYIKESSNTSLYCIFSLSRDCSIIAEAASIPTKAYRLKKNKGFLNIDVINSILEFYNYKK